MRWKRLSELILREVVSWLQVGAHCGLCGDWMEHELTYKQWPYSVCDTCKGNSILADIMEGK
jgi:hypothetical protein